MPSFLEYGSMDFITLVIPNSKLPERIVNILIALSYVTSHKSGAVGDASLTAPRDN